MLIIIIIGIVIDVEARRIALIKRAVVAIVVAKVSLAAVRLIVALFSIMLLIVMKRRRLLVLLRSGTHVKVKLAVADRCRRVGRIN